MHEHRPPLTRKGFLTRSPRPVRWGVQILLVLVGTAAVADALVGEQGLVAMMRARQQYDRLAGEVARQRADNRRMADEARRLRDDPATIEEVARRELGFIRPGEKVFIVRDLPPATREP